MKISAWPHRAALSVAGLLVKTCAALLSPIGFREVLLLGGSILLGIGASAVYAPAAFIVPGTILVGVALFGVRA